MNEKQRQDNEIEECEWCNSTGDIEKNRTIYWGTVLLVGLLIVVLYLLSHLLR